MLEAWTWKPRSQAEDCWDVTNSSYRQCSSVSTIICLFSLKLQTWQVRYSPSRIKEIFLLLMLRLSGWESLCICSNRSFHCSCVNVKHIWLGLAFLSAAMIFLECHTSSAESTPPLSRHKLHQSISAPLFPSRSIILWWFKVVLPLANISGVSNGP